MRLLRSALAIAFLVWGLSGCSSQTSNTTGAEPIDRSEPIAAAEARDEPDGPPPSRCNGFFDCAKTVVTDFVYLPVRVARGIGGDVKTVRETDQDAPAE